MFRMQARKSPPKSIFGEPRAEKPRRVSPSADGEIKFKFILSGGFADRKNTARLASVEFCALGAKLCAQSRRNPFLSKKHQLFRKKKEPPGKTGGSSYAGIALCSSRDASNA